MNQGRRSEGSGRACVFCGDRRELTKEHLLPQWLWREYGDPELNVSGVEAGPFGYQENRDLGMGYDAYVPMFHRPSIHPAGRTVRLVCAACNNGWMSRLELNFQSILREFITARSWRFSAREVRVARRWFQKTALMLERFDSAALMSGPDSYEAVFQNEEPPGTWYIGVGQQVRPTPVWAGSTPLMLMARETEGAADAESDDGTAIPIRSIPTALNKPIMYGLQHIIQVQEILFVVRHSPFTTKGSVRLDHELHCHPSGAFVPLDRRAAYRKWNRNKAAWLHPLSIEDLLYQWGHPIEGSTPFTLLGDGDERWLGASRDATVAELMAPFGITPTKKDLAAGAEWQQGGPHTWGD